MRLPGPPEGTQRAPCLPEHLFPGADTVTT